MPGNRKRGRDDVLSRSRIMGCAELNNPGRTRKGGKPPKKKRNHNNNNNNSQQKKIKSERNKRATHGGAWSSRPSARASSQPSPSLNGGSDGYFSTHTPRLRAASEASENQRQPPVWRSSAAFSDSPQQGSLLVFKPLFLSLLSFLCRVAGNIW